MSEARIVDIFVKDSSLGTFIIQFLRMESCDARIITLMRDYRGHVLFIDTASLDWRDCLFILFRGSGGFYLIASKDVKVGFLMKMVCRLSAGVIYRPFGRRDFTKALQHVSKSGQQGG